LAIGTRHLYEKRWPNGFICPKCKGGKAWALGSKPFTFECAACGRQTSVTAGTIFHRRHLNLLTWFQAIYAIASHSNGISALRRELDRLELLLSQIKAVESERDEMLEVKKKKKARKTDERKSEERNPEELADASPSACAKMLHDLKDIGPEFAFVIWHEGLYRDFDNRRQLASYAGLAPSPWQSGSIDPEQGVSKAGNPRLRCTMIELAWLWVRYQPQSALSLWFKQRVEGGGRCRG
jgi:transposase